MLGSPMMILHDASTGPSARVRLRQFVMRYAARGGLLALLMARPCLAQSEVGGDEVSPVGRSGVRATEPELLQAEASAYCRLIKSRADSVSALLYSPRVFSSFGLMRGTPVDPDGLANGNPDLVLNFRAGIEVSPTRMYAGSLLEQQAQAECGLHRAELALQDLPREGHDDRQALSAKAEVLRGASSAAEEILAASQQKLGASLTTLQAYSATRLRVEAHRRLLADIDTQLARLPNGAGPRPAPRDVFDALRFWESKRQAVDGRLRRLEGIDVALRGGYNELLAVPQQLPVFASVNVGFTPGWLWQKEAERQGAGSRRDWVEAKIARVRASLESSAERLGRELSLAQRHLQEVSVSLSDLELRYADLSHVRTSSAEELMEYLWFDLVRLRAERAYARAQVQSLDERRQSIEESLR